MLRLLPLLLLALFVTAGCDSGDGSDDGGEAATLNTAYLADGAWTFDSVVDDDEATDSIGRLLDDYTLDFDADGSVTVDIDVSDAVLDEDTRDLAFEGAYTLSGSTLRFSDNDDPDGFTVQATSQDQMELTGSGFYLLGLLGLDLELNLGDGSTLRLVRR